MSEQATKTDTKPPAKGPDKIEPKRPECWQDLDRFHEIKSRIVYVPLRLETKGEPEGEWMLRETLADGRIGFWSLADYYRMSAAKAARKSRRDPYELMGSPTLAATPLDGMASWRDGGDPFTIDLNHMTSMS